MENIELFVEYQLKKSNIWKHAEWKSVNLFKLIYNSISFVQAFKQISYILRKINFSSKVIDWISWARSTFKRL